MKNQSKIHLLTPDEAKKEVLNSENGYSMGFLEAGSGTDAYSYECHNGKILSCSGTSVSVSYESIDGKSYLKSVTCYDEEGYVTGGGKCDNSSISEGGNSGTEIATSPTEACEGKLMEQQCEWDESGMRHWGYCKRDESRPGSRLICKEY